MPRYDFNSDHEFFEPASDARIRKRRGKPRLDDEPVAGRSGRQTEAERARLARQREEQDDRPADGGRWSTWDSAEHGPEPVPHWVITAAAAVDTELGVLKTGKEAEVHLLRRGLPGEAGTLLAAKRYRASEHRMFHRDAGYLEGRRMRRSREMRAMASRSSFGRNLIAEQWAVAEFAALSRLWTAGVPVPYPVQRDGTELLLEFLGSTDGVAADRLATLRPDAEVLRELWQQLLDVLTATAAQGFTHGDLSAYNILVHNGKLMLIDLPQVVDLAANPQGPEFLHRDVSNICTWFHARGLPAGQADADSLAARLLAIALPGR